MIEINEGDRYGRLVIIKESGSIKYYRNFLCKCDCGNEVIVRLTHMRSGNSKSCGCLQSEVRKVSSLKHGSSTSRLYRTWNRMRQRCTNPRNNNFLRYGARGISVCKEWDDFMAFEKWSHANGYATDLTIDRINNNGNYEPGNCRWTTLAVQMVNKENNVFIEYNGQKKTISMWSRDFGLTQECLGRRLRDGWSMERASQMPPLKGQQLKEYRQNYK